MGILFFSSSSSFLIEIQNGVLYEERQYRNGDSSLLDAKNLIVLVNQIYSLLVTHFLYIEQIS